MNPRSLMGVTIRPEIQKRVARILARLPAERPLPQAAIRQRDCRPARRGPTKLSPRRVKTLRRLYAKGATFDVLARRFHVAVSTVWRAVRGQTWRS